MKILNKCPICGSPLMYSEYMQYTLDSKITRKGEVAKTTRKSESGSLECGFLSCTSEDCDFATDTDFHCEEYKQIKIRFIDGAFYYDIDDEDD